MKLIVAYIQPEKFSEVKKELYAQDIFKMSVMNAVGCGQQKGFQELYRGFENEVNLLDKIRIEIAVNEEYLDQTIDAIIKGAQTGKIGDGKIFVLNLHDCIRIRTGEKGKEAIG